MDLGVTLAVLCAAVLHAMWNGLVKGGKDPLLESLLISVVWLAICAVLLPFMPLPSIDIWPYVLVSVFVHIGYFSFLTKSYSLGDFGAVYPIVRGLPPMMVAMISFFVIGESISSSGWIGIATVSAGILALEIGKKRSSPQLLLFAFLTALMIATYTVLDGLGARISGNSTSFLLWLTVFQGVAFSAIVLAIRKKAACTAYIRTYWRRGVVGGTLSLAAYAIVLWAMTRAPIPYVSALRETSVLFASIIGVLFLAEPLRKNRIISAILIVCGIAVIKLG